jgi:hypothetical protein
MASAANNTPWINEGSLRVRFREEQNHLVKELNQPDRDVIMAGIQEEKKLVQKKDSALGYKVGSIPLVDFEIVIKKYPEFMDKCDSELKRNALIRFTNDPDMQQYVLRKA